MVQEFCIRDIDDGADDSGTLTDREHVTRAGAAVRPFAAFRTSHDLVATPLDPVIDSAPVRQRTERRAHASRRVARETVPIRSLEASRKAAAAFAGGSRRPPGEPTRPTGAALKPGAEG